MTRKKYEMKKLRIKIEFEEIFRILGHFWDDKVSSYTNNVLKKHENCQEITIFFRAYSSTIIS